MSRLHVCCSRAPLVLCRWSEEESGLLYVTLTHLHTGGIPVLLKHTLADTGRCTHAQKDTKSNVDLHIWCLFLQCKDGSPGQRGTFTHLSAEDDINNIHRRSLGPCPTHARHCLLVLTAGHVVLFKRYQEITFPCIHHLFLFLDDV